ncbi:hypothetical protein YB2330_002707 [Saitoella coloradoensis]
MAVESTNALAPEYRSIILSTSNVMCQASAGLQGDEFSRSLRTTLKQLTKEGEDVPEYAMADETTLVVPRQQPIKLEADPSEYEISAKLFLLTSENTPERSTHVRAAVDKALQALGVSKLNQLVVAFPDITFDAEDDASDFKDEDVEEWMHAWRPMEDLQKEGKVDALGVSEFGTKRIQRFMKETTVKPKVDQLNLRDCCVVPKSLIMYAKEQGIDLLTHGDSPRILSEDTLKDILDEFKLEQSGRRVVPQWVIKYAAVVKSRGVVETKGYIAFAQAE